MIDQAFKHCPIYLNILKTLSQKSCEEIWKLVNDLSILKRLYLEYQIIGRMSKKIFYELKVSHKVKLWTV